ncbi:HlyC/CorC family transporter [Lactobacillus sp. CC-MHH1034]|uniref:hemolysin family protein n=1 Tax=Agrilactobacillus fermenti TaxID=2586909 RepID=UPI001E29440A|nr:hemolysin family protein [Agrilactobacillus fermenti]MCD2255194.1 HlyC/CorC family transporter [Agrilactobacillus fermenti]
MSGDGGSATGQIILIIILTMVNAFFAAAEMAIVSVNRGKIQSEADAGDKKALKLIGVMNNSSRFLATIQVAITFAGFLSSASAATSLAGYLTPLLGDIPAAHEIAVVLITIALSYVSLVFGELFPKQVALSKAEAVAKFTVRPVQIVGYAMRPFVWLLSASTNLLLKIVPIDFSKESDQMTRDEMLSVIQNSRKTGIIAPDEFEMLSGIISFSDKMAREVMVPRTDAFMVNLDDDDQKNIVQILSEPYSRVPVYQGEKDTVVGLVHIKNILRMAHEVGFDTLKLADVMTEPLFVPETMTIDDLLLEFKKTQQQMAILLDEYGGVVGLVTIEDLLEEIVGEIDDESDQAEQLVTPLSETEFVVLGKMPLDDFNAYFHTDIDNPDVDTIAGYMITELGVIPTNHQRLELVLPNDIHLFTEKMDGSRLETIVVKRPESVTPDTEREPS